MACKLKPLLCYKVNVLMQMIEKSDRNWVFSMYYEDDTDVYYELKQQLKKIYNNDVQEINVGCSACHDGKGCDGGHGGCVELIFANRKLSDSVYIDLILFVKENTKD